MNNKVYRIPLTTELVLSRHLDESKKMTKVPNVWCVGPDKPDYDFTDATWQYSIVTDPYGKILVVSLMVDTNEKKPSCILSPYVPPEWPDQAVPFVYQPQSQICLEDH